jgi:hypothetical protein
MIWQPRSSDFEGSFRTRRRRISKEAGGAARPSVNPPPTAAMGCHYLSAVPLPPVRMEVLPSLAVPLQSFVSLCGCVTNCGPATRPAHCGRPRSYRAEWLAPVQDLGSQLYPQSSSRSLPKAGHIPGTLGAAKTRKSTPFHTCIYVGLCGASCASWCDRRALNPLVAGSIPARPTNFASSPEALWFKVVGEIRQTGLSRS